MRKLIFLLLLIFPTITFGQTYTGNYRAVFFNLFSEPKTIPAEFEIKMDNSIIANVKIGAETKLLNGSIDKKGKFEAVSQAEGNLIYKLKGKFDKNNKISFIRRIEERSSGSKSVSENGLEGTFAKVVAPVVEKRELIVQKEFTVIDNGKSQLVISHSTPLFGNQWNDFIGNVVFKVSEGQKQMELTANFTNDQQKRSIRIYTKPILPDQKIWRTTELQTASYREENGNDDERVTFLTATNIYAENKALQNGTLEIVKETETQIVFKLADFRIKQLTKDDFVELNGFIYAVKGAIGK